MDQDTTRAVKQLAWELDSRKSVEVRVATKPTLHYPDSGRPRAFDTISEHYIETAAGQRFCDWTGLMSGKIQARSSHYGDGSRFADVDYVQSNPELQNVISIKRQYWMEQGSDRKQVPAPLLYLYSGRETLTAALPKTQNLGKAEVMHRACNTFLFPRVSWVVPQDQLFYLDEATSIPLKVEAFRNKEARENHRPLWVWVAKSLDKVQGHYVTLQSTQTAFGADGEPAMTWDFNVEKIEFDKDYPRSTFWPKIQPGVTVVDGIADKTYQTPGAKPPVPEEARRASAPAQAVTAVPPVGWTPVISTASIWLGGATLVVGVGLWLRRR